MAFRSNQDAALARADALQRQLDEEKGALAATRAELDDTVAQLAAARVEAAAAAKKAEKSGKKNRKKNKRDKKKKSEVAAELRAAESKRARPVAKPKPKPKPRAKGVLSREEREAQDNRLRDSLGWFRYKEFAIWTLVVTVFVYRFLGYFHTMFDSVAGFLVLGGTSSVLIAFLGVYLHNYSTKSRVASEREWAKNLPFRLHGYPLILGARPASQPYGGEGNAVMVVKLTFRDEPPSELTEILQAFDSKLSPRDDGRFTRDAPITSYVRLGTRCYPDNNKALRKWIKYVAQYELAPLSKRYPLRSVEIWLSPKHD